MRTNSRSAKPSLDELFPETLLSTIENAPATVTDRKSPAFGYETLKDIVLVPRADIRPNPLQPRKKFDAEKLQELADSIRELRADNKGIGGTGILQPLTVRPAPPLARGQKREQWAKFQIVMGERRWLASQKAGLDMLPVVVRQLSDPEAYLQAFLENIQRADLSLWEEAQAVKYLREELKVPASDAPRLLGHKATPSWVNNRWRIATAPPFVQELAEKHDDVVMHTYYILRHVTDEDYQRRMVEEATRGASVERMRQMEREWLRIHKPEALSSARKKPDEASSAASTSTSYSTSQGAGAKAGGSTERHDPSSANDTGAAEVAGQEASAGEAPVAVFTTGVTGTEQVFPVTEGPPVQTEDGQGEPVAALETAAPTTADTTPAPSTYRAPGRETDHDRVLREMRDITERLRDIANRLDQGDNRTIQTQLAARNIIKIAEAIAR